MYKRIDVEDETNEFIDEYVTKEDVVLDATRYYHEHFTMDDDYNKDFEVKTYEQAISFWEANGYKIEADVQDDYQCPVCHSKNIECYGSEIDGLLLYYRYYCNDCHATFDGNYELSFTGYDNIVKGKDVTLPGEINQQHDQ